MRAGEAGLPRDPWDEEICPWGPGLSACHAPPPGPKAGRATHLSGERTDLPDSLPSAGRVPAPPGLQGEAGF